jgi:hypothetical protein
MNSNNWTFATLAGEQLDLIKEGEIALGVDYLLAFRQDERARPGYVDLFLDGLSAAQLDDSEVEVLEGLEQRLQAVVVAYQGAVR